MQDMITIVITGSDESATREFLTKIFKEGGGALAQGPGKSDVIRLSGKDEVNEKKGFLYKTILARVEKPLIEHILERTEGNQLKAARILGINRNTMRSKIKKLGIDPLAYKH